MSCSNPQTLAGRVALVTGGARRIGAALVAALAERGAIVVIHHLASADEATALAERTEASGARAYAIAADLGEASAASGLIEAAESLVGAPIDILINNASIFEAGGMEGAGSELWERHEAINLRAPYLLACSFASRLPEDARGDILNLNDIRVFRPDGGYLAYTASKVGLHGLTRSLARELAPRIRVNELALGAVLPPDPPGAEYEHVRREEILLRRFPSVEQVVGAMVFLLENTALTGQTLCIDGGRHLS